MMNRILEVCKEKGITQIELAEKMNITRQSLHSVITGDARFSSYQKIATALGVQVVDLFEKKEDVRIFVEYQGEKHEITTRDIIRLIEEPKIPDHENIRGAEYYK